MQKLRACSIIGSESGFSYLRAPVERPSLAQFFCGCVPFLTPASGLYPFFNRELSGDGRVVAFYYVVSSTTVSTVHAYMYLVFRQRASFFSYRKNIRFSEHVDDGDASLPSALT